jgi:hypothetical protein
MFWERRKQATVEIRKKTPKDMHISDVVLLFNLTSILHLPPIDSRSNSSRAFEPDIIPQQGDY